MSTKNTSTHPGFWRMISEDLAARGIPKSCAYLIPFFLIANRGFLVLFLYRVGQLFRRWSLIPSLCRRIGVLLTHASIHESSIIGPGLIIPHSTGVIVGRNVRIGRWVYIYSGVVLGPRGQDNKEATAPILEDYVHVYPHACIFGNVTIGRCSEIGANSVVLQSVPPRSVVMPPSSIVFKGMPFNMKGFPTELANPMGDKDPTHANPT